MVESTVEFKLSEVQAKAPSKLAFYKAMQRNGWFLPSFKSAIITMEYMTKVRSGSLFCP